MTQIATKKARTPTPSQRQVLEYFHRTDWSLDEGQIEPQLELGFNGMIWSSVLTACMNRGWIDRKITAAGCEALSRTPATER